MKKVIQLMFIATIVTLLNAYLAERATNERLARRYKRNRPARTQSLDAVERDLYG